MATGLRGILGVLIAPTDRFRKEIEKVGLNMRDVNPLYNKFGDILLKLRDHGFSVSNAFAGVDKRQAGAIITVIQGADAFQTLTDRISGTNAAFDMQAIQLKTVQSAWLLFKNNLTEIGLKFSDSLLPLMNAVLTPLTMFVRGLNETASTTNPLIVGLARVVTSTTLLTGAIITATKVVWPFVASILGLEAGMSLSAATGGMFSKVLTGLFSKLGLITGGIFLVVSAIGSWSIS